MEQVTQHKSVLLKEAVENLALRPDDVFLDGTLGGGGHTKVVLETYGPAIRVIAVDADPKALERSKLNLGPELEKQVTFVEDNFRNISGILERLGVKNLGGILLDLGLSSDELAASGRGFSFMKDEPLLMTFSPKQELTAMDIVNKWSEEELERVLREYGEEKFSRRIADSIVKARTNGLITTTGELLNAIKFGIPRGAQKGKIHFATRTFQALRIAANDEIGALKTALEAGFNALRAGGRMAVISFHSLEDREVKNFFRLLGKSDRAKILTKKPLRPGLEEIRNNPRSRSAKLRVIEKV